MADAERERRLPDAVADLMSACGLYRMWRPRTFGGLEVDPITTFRVLEEVSRIDSAAGWNLQLASAVDAFGAWFPDDGAQEIFGQPDTTFAGGVLSASPRGLRRWRLSGHRTDTIRERRASGAMVHGPGTDP